MDSPIKEASHRLQVPQNVLSEQEAFEDGFLCNIEELIVTHRHNTAEKVRLIEVYDVHASQIFQRLSLEMVEFLMIRDWSNKVTQEERNRKSLYALLPELVEYQCLIKQL